MRSLTNGFFFLAVLTGLSSCGDKQNFRVAPQDEKFAQVVTYNNKVDILWVVDTSRSMGTHQSHLASRFGSFIDVLVDKKFDFNLAITTMDMSPSGQKGKFVGRPSVITSRMSNAKDFFITNIQLGETGSDVERGLEAAKKSLSSELLGNENSGFFRSDAQLAIIFVSDEDDVSAGKPSDYAGYFDALKPANSDEEPPSWSSSFIGITVPDGVCFTRGEIADPGYRYMELANISKGQIAEICADDLSTALSNIRGRIVERLTHFKLRYAPVISSIRVTINGRAISEGAVDGWSFEPATRSILFHGASVPSADSRVEIQYIPDHFD